jgi:hypothetical protein
VEIQNQGFRVADELTRVRPATIDEPMSLAFALDDGRVAAESMRRRRKQEEQ